MALKTSFLQTRKELNHFLANGTLSRFNDGRFILIDQGPMKYYEMYKLSSLT